jgi:hypothetical protein
MVASALPFGPQSALNRREGRGIEQWQEGGRTTAMGSVAHRWKEQHDCRIHIHTSFEFCVFCSQSENPPPIPWCPSLPTTLCPSGPLVLSVVQKPLTPLLRLPTSCPFSLRPDDPSTRHDEWSSTTAAGGGSARLVPATESKPQSGAKCAPAAAAPSTALPYSSRRRRHRCLRKQPTLDITLAR